MEYKKIIFILVLFFSLSSKSQSILSITEITPIVCFGDMSTIELQINQTSPITILKCIVGYDFFGIFIPIVSTNNTALSVVNFPGLNPNTYMVRLVDSTSYFSTTPNGNNSSSIYDEQQIVISGVPQLYAIPSQIVNNICTDDSIAVEQINITGGTNPYLYIYNNQNMYLNNGVNLFDIPNLSSGSYSVIVTDVNGCTTSPSSSNFIIPIINPIINSETITSCDSFSWNGVYYLHSGVYTHTTVGQNGCDSTITLNLIILSEDTVSSSVFACDSFTWNGQIISNSGSYIQNLTNVYGCDSVHTLNVIMSLNITLIDSLVECDSYTWLNGITYTSSNSSDSVIYTSVFGCDSIVFLNLTLINSIVSNVSASSMNSYYWYGNTYFNSGQYTHVIQNSLSCDSIVQLNLTIYPQIVISTSIQDEQCDGLNNGAIYNSVTGGSGSFSCFWLGPNNYTNNQLNIANLSDGTYSLHLFDNVTNDSVVTTFMVNNGSILLIDTIITDVSCFGNNDGSISITNLNINNPTYLWEDGTTTNNRNNLSSGFYSVQITNSYSCIVVFNFTIEEPDTLFVISQQTASVCIGSSYGQIEVNVFGGTSPYYYVWNTGISDSIISNLTSGTYFLSIVDSNNCILQDSFIIDEYRFTLHSISTNVSCNGFYDGSIDISVINGIPPYTYSWSNGSITEDISNLSPTFYTCSIFDTLGCFYDTTIYIDEPDVLVATYNTTNVSCYGGNNGTVILNISGGFSPYNVDWGSVDINNLYAGVYPFNITDSNSCLFKDTVVISELDSLVVSSNKIDVLCYGENTGQIQIIITQGTGTPPYTYSWIGPNQFISFTEDIYNLFAGVYNLTITDANQCTKDIQVIVNQPPQLNQFVSLNTSNYNGYHIACKGGNSGLISVSVSGGYIPYSFLWSNGETNDTIKDLYEGIYNLIVSDGRGCELEYQINLLEPTQIVSGFIQSTSDYNGFDVSCFGLSNGSILEVVSGGVPPYTYIWNNGKTKDSIDGLKSDYYEVFVYDNNYCLWIDSITLNEPDSFYFILDVFTDTCSKNVGFTSVNTFGGVPPYIFDWSNGETVAIVNDFQKGRYEIIVNDQNQCFINDSVIINNLEKPKTDFFIFSTPAKWFDQSVDPIYFTDITDGYWQDIIDWEWDYGDNSFGVDSITFHSYSTIGTYRVYLTVYTEYNCIDTVSKLVTVNDYALFIPNAFTPSVNNNLNNYFHPKGFGISKYELKIFTRWGENIFSTNNLDQGWDGTYRNFGKECQMGVYTYSIILEDIFGILHTYQGQINLIR